MNLVADSGNYCLDDYASPKGGKRFIVFGQGIVSVKPDLAEVVIGVITENPQLEVAQEENAKATVQVINSIRGIGVLPKDMQTQNKAIVMANKLKVNLNITPIQITEQGAGTSTPLVMTLKYASETTPIEQGENKITADVEAVYIYM